MSRAGRWLILYVLFVVPALACNMAQGSNATSGDPPTSGPVTPGDATPPPQVIIESPVAGSQAVVGKDLPIRVHAVDSVGITRIEMRESGRIVASQFSPDSSRDFTTVFTYRLGSIGTLTLEVIAFRQAVASSPVTLSVDVVGSEAELKNPGSFDPTSGVAGAAICTVRPTSPLNLRAGPGTNYRVLATLRANEELSVIGRNTDSTWYLVKRSDTTTGWVSVPKITVDGDCSKAPVTAPAP
jgi:Bacterial SH3 domain/Bacterial Ig domain